MTTLRLLLTTLLLAACGGGSDDVDPPTCSGNGSFAYSYRFEEDGGFAEGDGSDSFDLWSFVNAGVMGDDGRLELSSMDGRRVIIDFPELLPNGGSVDARGLVELSSSSIAFGNCETGGYPSTLSYADEGGGGTFVLRDLRRSPYCTGEELRGSFAACWRSP